MMTAWFIICLVISITAFAGAIAVFILFFSGRFKERMDLPFQPAYLIGMGLFLLASWAVLIPVYAYGSDLNRFQTVVTAFSSALQEFTINLGAKDIFGMTRGIVCLQIYLAFFIVFSPVLTVGAVLSLIRDFFATWRLKALRRRGDINIYVFSELNPESAALAESILKEEYRELRDSNRSFSEKKLRKKLRKSVLLVFCDVRPSNEEAPSELVDRVQSINAMVFKKDITLLDLVCDVDREEPNGILMGKRVFFIIGSDHTENTEHMIKLNEKCRDYNNCSVILFSSSPTDGYILDTIDKGKHTVDSATLAAINDNAAGFIEKKQKEIEEKEANKIKVAKGMIAEESVKSEATKKKGYFDDCYYIRRIDCIDALAVQTLTSGEIAASLAQQTAKDKTITLLLVGLGQYGTAFLRNAIWLYQIDGYRLCIHIVDIENKRAMDKKLRRIMPDIADHLISKEDDTYLRYYAKEDGDCQYDIRIYPSVDCTAVDWKKHFSTIKSMDDPDPYLSFCKTRLVVIALGEDDKNIRAAVETRRFFDRANQVKNDDISPENIDTPIICSVVFDDKTVQNLNCNESSGGVVNYKAQPYQIHFIGQLADQYDYAHILDLKKQEQDALLRHFEWTIHQKALCKCFHREPDETNKERLNAFKAGMNDYFIRRNTEIAKENEGKAKDKQKALIVPGKWAVDDFTGKDVLADTMKYSKYEYYRESSIARSIHKNMLIDFFCTDFYTFEKDDKHADIEVCTCPKCTARMKTEHMRWAAYMRAHGYRYSKDRNDRAKLHHDLIPWQKLSYPEQFKD